MGLASPHSFLGEGGPVREIRAEEEEVLGKAERQRASEAKMDPYPWRIPADSSEMLSP